MSTPREAAERARCDPELASYIDGLEFPSPDEGDPAQAALELRSMTDSFFVRKSHPAVSERDMHVNARDGYRLRLRVFAPVTPAGDTKPLAIIFHSGGTCIGRPEETAYLCHLLVTTFNAVCVAPQYRLAPEEPSPRAMQDAWDAFQHIAANASDVGASPDQGLVVGGISAGATMAANIAHMARDEKISPALTGVWLGCGQNLQPEAVTDALRDRYRSRSQTECMTAPILPIGTLNVFNKAAGLDPHSAFASNLLWPSGHANLPRTYLQAAGMDVCRDENILYAEALREAGNETQLDIYPGVPHIFWQPFPRLKKSEQWRQDIVKNFAWLFRPDAK